MNLVDSLLEGAEADRDVLKKQLAMGDDPSIPRDVDFVLYAKDLEKAELVRDFVHDNSYGRSFVQEVPQNPPDSQHRIIVQVAYIGFSCAAIGYIGSGRQETRWLKLVWLPPMFFLILFIVARWWSDVFFE